MGERLSDGELVTFEKNAAPITFEGAAGVDATFALGSAVPHPHQLHLGAYSVHTSEEALAANGTSVNSNSVWTLPAIEARNPVRRLCSGSERRIRMFCRGQG